MSYCNALIAFSFTVLFCFYIGFYNLQYTRKDKSLVFSEIMELPKHSTGSRLVILWGAHETIFPRVGVFLLNSCLKKKKHYIAGDYLQNYTQ